LRTDFADSYIKADDPTNVAEVIEIASHAGKHEELVRFLQMARKSLREPKIDTELAYAYAKTDRLHDMEDFLGMTNVADILEVRGKMNCIRLLSYCSRAFPIGHALQQPLSI
jgi:clathrin heavy chain